MYLEVTFPAEVIYDVSGYLRTIFITLLRIAKGVGAENRRWVW
jgi:hypothetical protein